jgi:hypothetical protein
MKRRNNAQTPRKRAHIDIEEDEGVQRRKRKKTFLTMPSSSSQDSSDANTTAHPDSRFTKEKFRPQKGPVSLVEAQVKVDSSRMGPSISSRGRRVCLPQRFRI